MGSHQKQQGFQKQQGVLKVPNISPPKTTYPMTNNKNNIISIYIFEILFKLTSKLTRNIANRGSRKSQISNNKIPPNSTPASPVSPFLESLKLLANSTS